MPLFGLFSQSPTIRPWPDMFEFSKFAAPNNPQERVSTNLSYYSGNYLIIFGVLFAFTCLLNMFLLFTILFCIGGGYGLKMYLQQQMEVATAKSKTQKKKISKLNKQYSVYYVYGSIAVIILFGNVPLFSCLFLTLVIVLGHALLRKRDLKSKAVHFMDMYQDFGPISSLAKIIFDIAEESQSPRNSRKTN